MQLVRLASELVLCHDKPKSCPRSLVHAEEVVSGTATQMPKLPNYGNRYICPTVVALAEGRCARSADTCPLRRQIDRTRPDDLRHSNADSFSPVETSFSILLQQGGRLPSLRRVSPPIQLRVAFCWVHFSSQTSIRANMR